MFKMNKVVLVAVKRLKSTDGGNTRNISSVCRLSALPMYLNLAVEVAQFEDTPEHLLQCEFYNLQVVEN